MSAWIFLVIGTSEGNLFSFLSQLAYNSGILSKFASKTYSNHLTINAHDDENRVL